MSQHTVLLQVRPGSDSPKYGQKAYTAASRTDISETIAPGTNVPVVCAIDVSVLKSFYVKSSRDIVMTPMPGVPGPDISLKADVPYIWNTDSYDTFKFGAIDITSFNIDLAAGVDAVVDILVLQDSTP